VYLSIAKKDSSAANPHVHFVRPRQAIHCNVFRILIHIDAIEDLMLYHFPREDLVAGGKIPWWEFNWQFGRADRDLGEEVMHPLLDFVGRLGHSSEGLIEMMMTKTKSWGGSQHRDWLSREPEYRGRSRVHQADTRRGSGWHRGESYRGKGDRLQDNLFPSYWDDASGEEKRAMNLLWQEKNGTLETGSMGLDQL
jgi:hypothetical protein